MFPESVSGCRRNTQAEVVQVSIYSNIILHILRKHKEISVNKILVFAYLIKKDRFYLFNIYNGNNTQDIIYKCISLLAGDYVEYCNSISFIIKAIHLLIANKQVIFENNLLIAIPIENTDKMIYQESMFIDKAIEVSKRMTDKQFLREVTRNV